ncbi:MAG: hypothetical protein WAT25_07640 [Paracoccaceae bacterium]
MTRLFALPLALVLALPAAAQDAPVQEAPAKDAIDAVLDPAFAAQTIFLTCAAVNTADHAYVADIWGKTVDRITKTLTDGGIPADRVAALTAAAQPQALTLPDSTPFGEVRALCAANQDWMMNASAFSTLGLIKDLKKALP